MVGSRYDAPHCDYSDKGKAIRALTGDNRFTKDIDYKVFTQNGKNPTEGRSTIVYMITAFCVECLIVSSLRCLSLICLSTYLFARFSILFDLSICTINYLVNNRS